MGFLSLSKSFHLVVANSAAYAQYCVYVCLGSGIFFVFYLSHPFSYVLFHIVSYVVWSISIIFVCFSQGCMFGVGKFFATMYMF